MPEKFRLGDMLSLTLRAPLSFRWPVAEDRAVKLALYMTGGCIAPFDMETMLGSCADELRRQHPWLAGIDIPKFVQESKDWATLWAWLDTRERKHGVWHDVSPMSSDSIPMALDFDELPLEVQARLRELGFDPDS